MTEYFIARGGIYRGQRGVVDKLSLVLLIPFLPDALCDYRGEYS
jgi:hypothetical protein